MRFITKRTSKTGKKFVEIEKRRQEAHDAAFTLIEKIGASRWRTGFWLVFGGISGIIFNKRIVDGVTVPKIPDHLKEIKTDEYMPDRTTRNGKALQKKIDALPEVTGDDLNACIEFNGGQYRTIGVDLRHPKYILFSAEDHWECSPPIDCTEITVRRYKSLLTKKELTSS